MQPPVHARGATGGPPGGPGRRVRLRSAPGGRALLGLAYPLRSWWVVTRSGAFDHSWYRRQGGWGRGPGAVAHYVLRGRRAGLSPHPFFEPATYEPDTWDTSAPDPFATYLRRGPLRARPVHPLLDDAALGREAGPTGRGADVLRHAASRAARLPLPALDHPDAVAVAEVDRAVALAVVTAAVDRWRGRPTTPAEDEGEPVRADLDAADVGAGDLDPADLVPGRSSLLLVVPADASAPTAHRVVDAAVASLRPADDAEVVVVDDAGPRATAVALASWALRERRLRVVHRSRPVGRARATGLALGQLTGDLVCLVRAGVRLEPGWVGAVRPALEGAAAVQPLLLAESGSLRSVGLVREPGPGTPVPLLQDHPEEDGHRGGGTVLDVPCLDDAALVARTTDVRRAGGPDPDLLGAWDLSDLSLRLAGEDGTLRCALTATATVGEPDPPPDGGGDRAAGERFSRRWAGSPRWSGDPWSSLRLQVVRWDDRPRRARVSRVGVDGGPAPRRWAIRTGTPPGRAGLSWGDLHFARALAAALERLGQEVVVDGRLAHDRPTAYLDDVVLALRGVVPVRPDPATVSLCWVISHPRAVTAEELSRFDVVVAASGPWAHAASQRWGLAVGTLLQCTDPDRFAPVPEVAGTGPAVLFVGNSRNVHRPVVRDALAAGVDLSLHGSGWERFVDPDRVVARYVPNAELPRLYASCGVLLNDHWEDMRDEGFMSNRLFDAAAVGTRVVTDDVAGTEVFSGLVRTYRGAHELRDVLDDVDGAFPGPEQTAAVSARVRTEHSFDARARRLVELADVAVAARREGAGRARPQGPGAAMQ